MSFSISYTYKIIDKYTPQLREIQKQTESFNRKLNKLQKTSVSVNRELQKTGATAGKAARSFNRATNKMSAPMSKFSGRVGKLKGRLDKMSHSIGGVVSTIGGGLFFKKAASAGLDFEQATINLTKVFDKLNGKELKIFQRELAKVGDLIGQSETEMSRLAFQAGKLGIPIKDVAKFAELSGKVAIAFETDLGESTKFLADLRVKLGLNNEGLEAMLDTVNALADGSETSGREILNVTQRLSGVFKAMKVPPDVAAGLATVARRLEVSPERAATGMKMFLLRMQDVKKFGPGIAEALAKDLPGTIDKVLGKFREMEQAKRTVSIIELFGTEAAPFVMNLVESQKLYNETLGLAGNKTKTVGSMLREFNRQQTAGAMGLQKLKAEFGDLAKTFGMVLLPHLKSLFTWLKKIIQRFNVFSQAHPGITKFILVLAGIITVVAPILAVLGFLAGGVVALVSAVMVAWPIIAGLAAIFMSGVAPILAVVAGVAMITVGLSKMWEANHPLLAGLKSLASLFDRITGLNVLEWLNSVTGGISNLADSALGTLGDLGGLMGFGDDEKSINVKKQTSNQTRLDGNIRVQAEGGAKVTGGSVKSSSPGNVGLNLAGAL